MGVIGSPSILSVIAWAIWLSYWMAASKGSSEPRWKESWLGRAQHLLPTFIGFHFIYGQHSLFPARLIPERYAWPALALQLCGLGFAVWARLHLGAQWSGTITEKVDHRLIRTGPYRWIRHPIYTGFVIAVLGSFLCRGPVGGLLGFLLIVTSFCIKLKREEKLLGHVFGVEYQQYKKKSWALIPWIW